MLLNVVLGLLRDPSTARRSNQSILKEISPEYSLEGLMLKLKLPILRPPDAKNWLIGKDPDAGKDWSWEKGTIEKDNWMALLTGWTWVWVNSGRWWWTAKPGMLQSMGLQRVRHERATELNWFWQWCQDSSMGEKYFFQQTVLRKLNIQKTEFGFLQHIQKLTQNRSRNFIQQMKKQTEV